MSLPAIKVVDVQHDNKVLDLEDLTSTALGALLFECGQLHRKLEDAFRKAVDENE